MSVIGDFLKKQMIDQSAHMAAAIVILAPVLIWPGILTAALSGFGIGLVREITERDSLLSRGSLLDLAFWAIGGAIAGAFFH